LLGASEWLAPSLVLRTVPSGHLLRLPSETIEGNCSSNTRRWGR
jgi:hypothetical protein